MPSTNEIIAAIQVKIKALEKLRKKAKGGKLPLKKEGLKAKDLFRRYSSSMRIRALIFHAAKERLQIVIRYKKVNRKSGERTVKRYEVCPMSYRLLRLKAGLRKVLFAHDVLDKHVKSFVLRNIKTAEVRRPLRKYPRLGYPVEIGRRV